MGRRGPPRKPTELKIVQGVPGGEHKLNKHEPKPKKTQNAKPPRWLGKEGKKIWKIVVPKLESLKIMSEIDINALGRYCDMLPRWIEARNWLDEHGQYFPVYYPLSPKQVDAELEGKTVKKIVKNMKLWPQVKLYRELSTELSRLEAQFGMTPASRSAISTLVTPGDNPNDFRERLYGNRGK